MKLLRWTFALTYWDYSGTHYLLDCGPRPREVAIIYRRDIQMRVKTNEFPEVETFALVS